jgi:hypothetical protein
MRRETVNRICFILEDVVPPILRDSPLFRDFARIACGDHIEALAEFRARAPFLSSKEYEALYRKHPPLTRLKAPYERQQEGFSRTTARAIDRDGGLGGRHIGHMRSARSD